MSGGSPVPAIYAPTAPKLSVLRQDPGVVVTAVLEEAATGKVRVQPLQPGKPLKLQGTFRQVYVVTVNADPKGEMFCDGDRVTAFQRTACTSGGGGGPGGWCWSTNGYPNNLQASIRSPPIAVPPGGAELTFDLRVETEEPSNDTYPACTGTYGWDGAQVRVISDDKTLVLSPTQESASQYNSIGIGAILSAAPVGGFSCDLGRGWTGTLNWSTVAFSLDQFAGKSVRFELAFFSDAFGAAYGVEATNFVVKDRSTGQGVIFSETNTTETGVLVPRLITAPIPSVDSYTGVPYLVDYPSGCTPDRTLSKETQKLTATWSAQWTQGNKAKQQLFGYAYLQKAPSLALVLASPGYELLVPVRAPFAAVIDYAVLSTLRNKEGIKSVYVSIRSTTAPYRVLATASLPSPGPLQEPVQRFAFVGTKNRPTIGSGQKVFLAVGVVGDPSASSSFLSLPLADGPSASVLVLGGKNGPVLKEGSLKGVIPISGMFVKP
eukprot:TRINITY_DN10021_c0_g1_i2.p1 TRINITY_DN10021_c0_g1~~TRINITY_DN10021_c0_g1_i2.p1  ORF type:complete len:491 (+),score=99.90 TRINITY_DN10021_c0_g1_i2:3-1475(+)